LTAESLKLKESTLPHNFIGIDHVQIAAPPGSEVQARKFFVDALGMTEVLKPASLRARGGIGFQCGAQQLHVGIEADFSPAKKAHPAIRVHNLSDLRLRLRNAGITVIEDDNLPDAERFYVNDPFGNRLEFLQLK
jgi:catechol 2,3-dioxygenase-like lactoylglutathione lyase family enzyme